MSKISIILPTYNVEQYIARALNSCIEQSFKDIEIIIVDDFGNDKSIDIAKEYAKKDERIKIIHNEKNLGTFASRNIGVLNSNSEFIMFLDPDDYLDIRACEECMKILDEQDFDLICFNFVKFNDKYRENVEFYIDRNYDKYAFMEYILSNKYPYFNIWGKLINKEKYIDIFLKYKLDDIKMNMAEDVLFNWYLINNINNIATLKECFYFYFENINSISKRKNKEDYLYFIKAHELLLKHLKDTKNICQNIDFFNFYFDVFDFELKKYKYELKKINNNLNLFDKLKFKLLKKKFSLCRRFRLLKHRKTI